MNLSPCVDWLGYAAAVLTTVAFVPQACLTFKTRDVSGISLGMYSAFTLGVALWLAYGWTLQAWPIVVANVVTLMLALSILLMKLLISPRAPTSFDLQIKSRRLCLAWPQKDAAPSPTKNKGPGTS